MNLGHPGIVLRWHVATIGKKEPGAQAKQTLEVIEHLRHRGIDEVDHIEVPSQQVRHEAESKRETVVFVLSELGPSRDGTKGQQPGQAHGLSQKRRNTL